MPEKYAELSLIQRRFIETLDDEKVVAITEAASLLRALPDEAKEFLRGAKPETLTFLKDLRPDEINELANAIENTKAFRRAGKLVRWGIVTLFGTFVGISMIWDKVSSLWKATK